MEKARNIVLVGLMGSGKTTVGKALARKLGVPFVDSDHEIEARTGVRIPTIFEVEGEIGFRRRESQMVAELCARDGIVIATGGGAVMDPENRRVMRADAWVVYLDVPVKLLYERTRHDENRPLLQVADPLAKLESLRAQRDPLYREVADFVLDGGRYHSNQAVQRLFKEWEARCAASK
ncbi:shikimate kinase [Niveibacterium sp. SC-1]|uniref:shikimate kinase n=1 Tax=Niveibacterium sp. SC-1 TaxID=3135646 RepID=UPI00311E402A